MVNAGVSEALTSFSLTFRLRVRAHRREAGAVAQPAQRTAQAHRALRRPTGAARVPRSAGSAACCGTDGVSLR